MVLCVVDGGLVFKGVWVLQHQGNDEEMVIKESFYETEAEGVSQFSADLSQFLVDDLFSPLPGKRVIEVIELPLEVIMHKPPLKEMDVEEDRLCYSTLVAFELSPFEVKFFTPEENATMESDSCDSKYVHFYTDTVVESDLSCIELEKSSTTDTPEIFQELLSEKVEDTSQPRDVPIKMDEKSAPATKVCPKESESFKEKKELEGKEKILIDDLEKDIEKKVIEEMKEKAFSESQEVTIVAAYVSEESLETTRSQEIIEKGMMESFEKDKLEEDETTRELVTLDLAQPSPTPATVSPSSSESEEKPRKFSTVLVDELELEKYKELEQQHVSVPPPLSAYVAEPHEVVQDVQEDETTTETDAEAEALALGEDETTDVSEEYVPLEESDILKAGLMQGKTDTVEAEMNGEDGEWVLPVLGQQDVRSDQNFRLSVQWPEFSSSLEVQDRSCTPSDIDSEDSVDSSDEKQFANEQSLQSPSEFPLKTRAEAEPEGRISADTSQQIFIEQSIQAARPLLEGPLAGEADTAADSLSGSQHLATTSLVSTMTLGDEADALDSAGGRLLSAAVSPPEAEAAHDTDSEHRHYQILAKDETMQVDHRESFLTVDLKSSLVARPAVPPTVALREPTQEDGKPGIP